jgi:hypothetical protein
MASMASGLERSIVAGVPVVNVKPHGGLIQTLPMWPLLVGQSNRTLMPVPNVVAPGVDVLIDADLAEPAAAEVAGRSHLRDGGGTGRDERERGRVREVQVIPRDEVIPVRV